MNYHTFPILERDKHKYNWFRDNKYLALHGADQNILRRIAVIGCMIGIFISLLPSCSLEFLEAAAAGLDRTNACMSGSMVTCDAAEQRYDEFQKKRAASANNKEPENQVAMNIEHKKPPPIYRAVRKQRISKVKRLLAKGADANTRFYGQSLLEVAVVDKNNIELAKVLLQHGAHKSQINELLSEVISKNQFAMTKWLIEQGADVNYKIIGGLGDTPLIVHAIGELYLKKGGKKIIHHLLEQKNLDIVTHYTHFTPLYMAVLQTDVDLAERLVQINPVVLKQKDELLAMTIQHDRSSFETKKHYKMAHWLIGKGANVNRMHKSSYQKAIIMNQRETQRRVPLLVLAIDVLARRGGDTMMVDLLLEQKHLKINAKDEKGRTALGALHKPWVLENFQPNYFTKDPNLKANIQNKLMSKGATM